MNEETWRCPWCLQLADQNTKGTISESRTCRCGSVGFRAAFEDSDEIIDDAASLFGVTIRETSRGFNDLILADIALGGVDVRGGKTDTPLDQHPRRSIWFKKPKDDPGD